jgi:hypothetical protein
MPVRFTKVLTQAAWSGSTAPEDIKPMLYRRGGAVEISKQCCILPGEFRSDSTVRVGSGIPSGLIDGSMNCRLVLG